MLESVLDDQGYRLRGRRIRPSSAPCLDLAEEFALLVVDIQMPGMNGFELAQMIKQRQKTAGVPIIFLTAYYSEDRHVLEGYSNSARDYLHKPINRRFSDPRSPVAKLYRRAARARGPIAP